MLYHARLATFAAVDLVTLNWLRGSAPVIAARRDRAIHYLIDNGLLSHPDDSGAFRVLPALGSALARAPAPKEPAQYVRHRRRIGEPG
jgi:hypothetical protein